MLVEALIAQMCAGLAGPSLDACHKGFEAASIQTHVKQTETDTTKLVTDKAMGFAESAGIEKPVGATIYLMKVARDKKVEYRVIRNDGFVPDVTPGATLQGGSLNLRWHF